MELVKLILLLICGLVKIMSLRVNTYSQILMKNFNDLKSRQEVVLTQMIEVYNDKGLTQKKISFDNVGYFIHSNANDVKDGVVFNTDKSNNSGIAKNYFSDKADKMKDEVSFLIPFSSFFKCEVMAVPRPSLNYDVVQIGLLDRKGNTTYIAMSYGSSDKSDKKILAQQIGTACKEYVDSFKKSMDEFWKEVSGFWKTKMQVQQIQDQIKQLSIKHKVENDLLAQVTSDKLGFEKSQKQSEEDLSSTKLELNAIETKLKEEYKILANVKTRKADNEKNITMQNSTLTKLDADTQATQKRLDEFNKESDSLRTKADVIIKKLSDVKQQMYGLEFNLTNERDGLNLVSNEIDFTNKQINDNGKQIANFNKDIKTSRDFLDKLAIEDLPTTINKTKTLVDEYEKASEKTMNETEKADLNILYANQTIIASKDKLKALLSDKKVIKNAKKAKIKNNIEQARIVFETFRKIFPIVPDVFMNNLWTFNSMNHYEAMNYIQSVKPSFYGLYDFVFGPNDPARVKAAAKRRRMKKRKMKKY